MLSNELQMVEISCGSKVLARSRGVSRSKRLVVFFTFLRVLPFLRLAMTSCAKWESNSASSAAVQPRSIV